MTQSGAAAAGDISGLLRAWSGGDQSALDRLTPIVYDELHRLARRYMRHERPGHSLQTAAPPPPMPPRNNGAPAA